MDNSPEPSNQPPSEPRVPCLYSLLAEAVGAAFEELGFDASYGTTLRSSRPELGDFQCNGAMACAKVARTNPRGIAESVANILRALSWVDDATVAGPGFINITVSDAYLTDRVDALASSPSFGCKDLETSQYVVLDYGGANIAKPLHVGHLRSAVIGDSLKRLGRAIGHDVIGDIHLGDWGLQMGQVICEIAELSPELPFFAPEFSPSQDTSSPVTVDELEEIYPVAAHKAKSDPRVMAGARDATEELQAGNPGYRALWRHLVDVSVDALRRDYSSLGVEFELWLGESDCHEEAIALVETAKTTGATEESEGALVVRVARSEDSKPLPPLILQKADGAILYGTTDLATIVQRMRDYRPDVVLYVVDQRQHLHFEQVFRAARQLDLVPATTHLEHIGFGTMNGTDGKPFKTRAGGVMRLNVLMEDIHKVAMERIASLPNASSWSEDEKQSIATDVAIATLKFADLSNNRISNYVFDPEKFCSFEGKTGPYLLYATLRARSVLKKAQDLGMVVGETIGPFEKHDRELALLLAETNDTVLSACQSREPHILCTFVYELASKFNQFYANSSILREEDESKRASMLALLSTFDKAMTMMLQLLGISIPSRM